MSIPEFVFIIPYRDRETMMQTFLSHMPIVLEGLSYKFLFVHQCDNRMFNRGALKNIGFLFVKKSYPDNYRDITLVFNDIDCLPRHKGLLNYSVRAGEVKHFYGYTYTLGGIVSINAGDFERIGGFPNFWGWGYEDNMLQKRVLSAGITINRNQFYEANVSVMTKAAKQGLPIPEFQILQEVDGNIRTMNRHDFKKYAQNTRDGIGSFCGLVTTYDANTYMLNVHSFDVGHEEKKEDTFSYDLANGSVPLKLRKFTQLMFM
jgi:hypothetical protein